MKRRKEKEENIIEIKCLLQSLNDYIVENFEPCKKGTRSFSTKTYSIFTSGSDYISLSFAYSNSEIDCRFNKYFGHFIHMSPLTLNVDQSVYENIDYRKEVLLCYKEVKDLVKLRDEDLES